ncbi:hypothetical protein SAMN05216327_102131 [Dyadobacter sp. SG02]|uniref:hypothetical protein n=1 Tax=Dyadobacter sp. SG02 TaxID=1855291 RepID=UPI0008CE0C85|nr:hypothetical protein [Dyadobacter sp. SG02]SEI51217.1 hypothetical protein SAMN05216327_102131 [Dyadobacter sp. SG02]
MDTQQAFTEFKAYLAGHPDALDLQLIDDASDFPFDWGPDVMKHLRLFAKTGTGSYIGFWSPDGAVPKNPENLPLVWIDHEGVPMSVFARNTDDFLAFMHFDTGFIYEILIDYHFYKTDPAGYDDPAKKFTKKYLTKYLKEKDSSPDFKALGHWLSEKLGVSIPADPADMIGKAIDAHKDFNEWLHHDNL